MSNLRTQTENPAKAVFRITGECQLANKSAAALAKPDPERHHSEKTNYEHHLVEAITTALAINDEFYKGLAIRRVINVCRNANELDIAKTLFKEVDHPSLREQIVKDVPELAGERRLCNENACQTVPIHLDGLERDAIIHLVTKAMRNIGACEREIEGFKNDARSADYDTMLAKAIDWGAPVQFLKSGQPWIKGDWKRLTLWQRVKRKYSLWGGSYVHPDGTIELAAKRETAIDC
jgi:hypothetical protein